MNLGRRVGALERRRAGWAPAWDRPAPVPRDPHFRALCRGLMLELREEAESLEQMRRDIFAFVAMLIGDADLVAAAQRAEADLEEKLGRALATMSEDTRLEALATGAALVGYLEHQLAAESTPEPSLGASRVEP